MDSLPIYSTATYSIVVVLLLITQFALGLVADRTLVESSAGELSPAGPTEYRVFEVNIENARRKLTPFQLCLPCKCCAATGGAGPPSEYSAAAAAANSTSAVAATCATMPCCFGIDCHLPNKPFGVCAFVPKTCNCTSCAGV